MSKPEEDVILPESSSPPAATYQPEWDGEWFIPGTGLAAPSLRALQLLVGPHVILEGYYPDGYAHLS